MLINEKVEVLKEGSNPDQCRHSTWVIDFHYGTPKDTYEYNRICKVCGRVEKVTEQYKVETYSEVFEKFYGEVK